MKSEYSLFEPHVLLPHENWSESKDSIKPGDLFQKYDYKCLIVMNKEMIELQKRWNLWAVFRLPDGRYTRSTWSIRNDYCDGIGYVTIALNLPSKVKDDVRGDTVKSIQQYCIEDIDPNSDSDDFYVCEKEDGKSVCSSSEDASVFSGRENVCTVQSGAWEKCETDLLYDNKIRCFLSDVFEIVFLLSPTRMILLLSFSSPQQNIVDILDAQGHVTVEYMWLDVLLSSSTLLSQRLTAETCFGAGNSFLCEKDFYEHRKSYIYRRISM